MKDSVTESEMKSLFSLAEYDGSVFREGSGLFNLQILHDPNLSAQSEYSVLLFEVTF